MSHRLQTKLLITLTFLKSASVFAWSQYEKVDYAHANPKPPTESSCVKNISKTITVSGTFDGKGCLYKWVGKGKEYCRGTSDVPESMPRMFVMKPGSTIKNLQMDCSPDGILMNDNTTIDNVVNRDCGDDCVTTNGKNNVIKNSEFYLCQNKCIQLNYAKGVIIQNNKFFHAWRPMSGTNSKGGATGIKARGNSCYNCDIEFLLFKEHEVSASDNTLDKGNCMFETNDKSVIYDEGGNTASRATLSCPKGTHNVKPR